VKFIDLGNAGSNPVLANIKYTNMDIQKRAMIEALEKSLGIVTTACKMVDIARSTHYLWMSTDEEYKEAVEAIADLTLDFVESQLHKQIQKGEVTSTIFYLKTKGKKRGFIEKQEIEHSGNMQVNWVEEKTYENKTGSL
jgi:hypothetical protein